MAILKGCIFDIDGTLADSMGIWGDIDRAFLEKRSIAMPDDYIDALNSMSFSQAAEYTIKRFSLDESPEAIMNEWKAMSEYAYAHTIKLKEGVLEFVNKTNFQRYLMIVKSTGIISPAMIRSQNVLNFGYALYLLLRAKGENAAIIEKVVRRWLVLTILTGRYSGSPESTFDYDIKRFQANDPMEFLEHTEAGELSDAFWNNILVTKLDTSVASSPMFHVFLMAQVKMGDCGFLSEQIDVKSLIEQRGDIHHIFPKKYLQKCGIKERGMYNQIANYVYTQSEINIRIKDQAPKEYMAQVKEQCTGGNAVYGGIDSLAKLEANMAANCIPQEIFDMDYTQFVDFLEKRRRLMARKIRNYYELLT